MTFKRKTPDEVFAVVGGVSGLRNILTSPNIELFGENSILTFKEIQLLESLANDNGVQITAYGLNISRQRVYQIRDSAIRKLLKFKESSK